MRRPFHNSAMMKKARSGDWFPKNPHPLNPSPNFPKGFGSDLPGSNSPPPSSAPAGDVSPPVSPILSSAVNPSSFDCEFDSQRDVDEWGDTFVPETPDAAGDVVAGETAEARWAGCIAPDTLEGFCDFGSPLHVPSSVGDDQFLSVPSVVDPAVIEEERKQKLWEERMLKTLERMKEKAERQLREKIEASASIALAEEKDEQKWDKKIDNMLAKMKAKEAAQIREKLKSKNSVNSGP